VAIRAGTWLHYSLACHTADAVTRIAIRMALSDDAKPARDQIEIG
jgi:hypothetical protein